MTASRGCPLGFLQNYTLIFNGKGSRRVFHCPLIFSPEAGQPATHRPSPIVPHRRPGRSTHRPSSPTSRPSKRPSSPTGRSAKRPSSPTSPNAGSPSDRSPLRSHHTSNLYLHTTSLTLSLPIPTIAPNIYS